MLGLVDPKQSSSNLNLCVLLQCAGAGTCVCTSTAGMYKHARGMSSTAGKCFRAHAHAAPLLKDMRGFLSACMSIDVYIYIYIYISIHLSTYLSIYLSTERMLTISNCIHAPQVPIWKCHLQILMASAWEQFSMPSLRLGCGDQGVLNPFSMLRSEPETFQLW